MVQKSAADLGDTPVDQAGQGGRRDHLFISYAIEDVAFVRWLAGKLALSGYRVWWDRTHLHGGDSFPSEIDDAIKLRAFRVLAVMSHSSSHKPNPERERSVSQAIARERGETSFLIPLNIELTASELPFQVANQTFVPFMTSWAEGLTMLLTDLRASGAPCFPTEATMMVSSQLARPTFLVDEPEAIWANLFVISGLPADIGLYEWNVDLPDEVSIGWVCHRENNHACWSFESPPVVPGCGEPRRIGFATSSSTAEGRRKERNACTSLLRQYVERRCTALGLTAVPSRRHFYFPATHTNAARLSFVLPSGRATWLQPVGERSIWQAGHPERIRCHLSVIPRVELTRFGAPVVQIRPSVYFTSLDGTLLDSSKNVRRAKTFRRTWYNDKWLARVAALGSFLADGKESWLMAPTLPITVSGVPLGLMAPMSLDEAAWEAARVVVHGDDDETHEREEPEELINDDDGEDLDG